MCGVQKDTSKGSLRTKFMRAAWDDRYLPLLAGPILKCGYPGSARGTVDWFHVMQLIAEAVDDDCRAGAKQIKGRRSLDQRSRNFRGSGSKRTPAGRGHCDARLKTISPFGTRTA